MKLKHHVLDCPFRVEPFSEDCTGKLSWGVLGNLLLRVSELHAAANDFGYQCITPKNKAWVLSRLTIVMEERPKTYEEFQVSTWVDSYFRQFTTRQYAIRNVLGNPLGYATSVWAMIDTESRAPFIIEQFDTEGCLKDCLVNQKVPISETLRFRVQVKEHAMQYTTAYTDLDINGHVNSIRYVQLLLNLFPLSHHIAHPLKRIDLIYAKESYGQECLSFFVESQKQGEYTVQITNEKGENVVKALLAFAVPQ